MKEILDLIDNEDLIFDFYIERYKERNVHTFIINEFGSTTIEFTAEINYQYQPEEGGAWDETLHYYIETSRAIHLLSIYINENKKVLTPNERRRVENRIKKKATFNLY